MRKMTFVGLKQGLDLEDRAAQPLQEFPGVTPPPSPPPPTALENVESSVGRNEENSRSLELSSTIMKKVCPFLCLVFIREQCSFNDVFQILQDCSTD